MKITFVHNNKTYMHTLKNRIVKIYSVPVEYSEDGLFIADYSIGMSEPIPASISLKTKLLLHTELRTMLGQECVNEVINLLGDVEYAKD